VVVLTQKNQEGDEFPVDFMSFSLQGVELNYPEVENKPMLYLKLSNTSGCSCSNLRQSHCSLPCCQESTGTERLSRKES
jgi:hypothetical protein